MRHFSLCRSHPFVPDCLPPLLHYMVCILYTCSVVTCDNIPTIGAGHQTPANLGLHRTRRTRSDFTRPELPDYAWIRSATRIVKSSKLKSGASTTKRITCRNFHNVSRETPLTLQVFIGIMNTLPDELLLQVIHYATDVASELDSNLDDCFRVPSPADMEEMLKTVMPTRRVLALVSRHLWSLATPALYRSVIITHPHTFNLLFRSIKTSGERSLLFRRGVRRFHLSIRNRYQWDIFPGTEELMKYLPNLKITCARGWRHPTKPLLFTALDPATSFHHLEAIEYSFGTHFLMVMTPTINLLRSSPNLRVFLVPCHKYSKPNLYAFKYLRGCYIDDMIHSSPSDDSIGPDLEDTNKQPLSSQTPFPPLRSLYFTGEIYQNINHNLTRHITLLYLAYYMGSPEKDPLDLSQFPQLRTLVISPAPHLWYFKVSDKNDKLREVGVHSDVHPLHPIDMRDCRALVELVLGLPVRIQRLRVLGFDMCRVYAALGLYRSIELVTWRKELEERGISLEGPNGVPFVECLASLPR